jgi:hypothetical protein
MIRPKYETDINIQREEEVAKMIGEAWSCLISKPLPHRYVVDRAVTQNNELKVWVEIKNSTQKKDAFPEYTIALHKIAKGLELAKATGVKFILVVRFDSNNNSKDVYWIECNERMFKRIRWGGVLVERDSQDQEPMVCIPMYQFEKLKKRPN